MQLVKNLSQCDLQPAQSSWVIFDDNVPKSWPTKFFNFENASQRGSAESREVENPIRIDPGHVL